MLIFSQLYCITIKISSLALTCARLDYYLSLDVNRDGLFHHLSRGHMTLSIGRAHDVNGSVLHLVNTPSVNGEDLGGISTSDVDLIDRGLATADVNTHHEHATTARNHLRVVIIVLFLGLENICVVLIIGHLKSV